MDNVIPLKHPAEPFRNSLCRHCHMRQPLNWQPNCEAHAYVGEQFRATIVRIVECTRHEECDEGRPQELDVHAEVAFDPIGEEWLVSEIWATDDRGRVQTLSRDDESDALSALVAEAERARELDQMKRDRLPFVEEVL